MESCLLIALALVALALPVAGLVVGVIALRRSDRLAGRITDLELEVSRLRRQGVAAERAAEGAEAAEPAPEEEPERPPGEPPEEAPEPVAPPPSEELPETPEPRPEVRAEPGRPALETTAPESPPDEPPGDGDGIDWERWIGLRGAAALAGVLLALAGLYFVRYSIEAGWLAPPVRVALGLATGVAAVLGSQPLGRRGYEDASNGLAGGGVVVLYAAVWAARVLYELIPTALAFVLMVLITAVCGLLAWRRASLVVALLGLIGGFATPLLVGSETESPLGLFGYLLLLNAGLLLLARHRRWPLLPPLTLLATLFYEGLWILDRMEPADLPMALAILTLFAALFALAAGRRPSPEANGETEEAARRTGVRGAAVRRAGLGSLWRATRGAAVLLPFLFALYFAGRADLGEHLWPVAAMLLVLSVGAEWLARGWAAADAGQEPGELGWLGSAAAVFATTVTAVWALDGQADAAIAWETTAIAVGLALGFHLFVEVDLTRLRRAAEATAGEPGAPRAVSALLSAAGLLGLLIVDALADPRPHAAARLVGWGVLAALLIRQTALPDVRRRQVAATAAVGAAFPLFHLVHDSDPGLPEPSILFGLLVAAGIVLQILPAARERLGGLDETARRWAEGSAAALPLAAAATLALGALAWDPAPWLLLATSLALGLLATLAATRLPSGAVLFLAMLLTALTQTAWGSIPEISGGLSPEAHLAGLGAGAAAVLWFSAWPFLARPRLDAHRWAWYAAALAGPAWFPALRDHWLERFGDGAVGLLPVLLGAVALAGAFRVASDWDANDPGRLRGLVWFSAVALGAAALAIPLQLDREWVTVGWALEGVAVIALWRRLEHPGLKLFGLALLATAAARLLLDPAGWIGAPPDAKAAWLAYTHLVPVAALVGAALLLGPLEVARLERGPAWQRRLYRVARPLGTVLCGAGAILVGFVWINRTVLVVYGTAAGAPADSMARDLTLSLAWAVYALLLAGLGFARSSRGLRGVGLGLLALTVVKLFLYDLADLEDLYRVASLVGLALSLMLVSLAYQRFVFRGSAEEQERSGRAEEEPGPNPKEPS